MDSSDDADNSHNDDMDMDMDMGAMDSEDEWDVIFDEDGPFWATRHTLPFQ
jgi:hypothetical protein